MHIGKNQFWLHEVYFAFLLDACRESHYHHPASFGITFSFFHLQFAGSNNSNVAVHASISSAHPYSFSPTPV